MANTKSYTVLAMFGIALIAFLAVVGNHVTTKLKHLKTETTCVQELVSNGHPRSDIITKDGTCSIKPLM